MYLPDGRCPTGGINQENFHDYLAIPNVASVGGHWMAPTELVEAGDWDTISRFAAESIS